MSLSSALVPVCLEDTFGNDCSLTCDDCRNGGACNEERTGCDCPEGWSGILCNQSECQWRQQGLGERRGGGGLSGLLNVLSKSQSKNSENTKPQPATNSQPICLCLLGLYWHSLGSSHQTKSPVKFLIPCYPIDPQGFQSTVQACKCVYLALDLSSAPRLCT